MNRPLLILALLSASCGRVGFEAAPCKPLTTFEYTYTQVSGLDCCVARLPRFIDHKALFETLELTSECLVSHYEENRAECTAKIFARCWKEGELFPMSVDYAFESITGDSVSGRVGLVRGECQGVFEFEGKLVEP